MLPLGRQGETDYIGILIKNDETRHQIKTAHEELKNISTDAAREYLEKHGLLKVGSHIPDRMIHFMYENAVMTGDIFNKDRELLLHNCLAMTEEEEKET